ncbi:MAG: hypothetical protein ACP5NF_05375 [Thermoanaerobaculum sp.]
MRKAKPMLTLVMVSGFFVASAAAQMPVGSAHLIPVVAKLKGALGTDWVSDVAISSLEEKDFSVSLYYFPEKTDNAFPPVFSSGVLLTEGRTTLLSDVIGTQFPSAGNSTKGMLLVMTNPTPDGTIPSPRIAVTSRTYNNADPNRTYGQTVPSSWALVWGGGKAVLSGVRQDSRFRTNIGVVNLSMGEPAPPRIKVRIQIYGPAGNLVQDKTMEVKSLSLEQWDLPRDLGVSSLAVGRVEVSLAPDNPGYDRCQVRTDPSAPGYAFLAYYSKVDNSSGDAEFGIGQLDWSAYEGCPQPPSGDPCQRP